MEREVAEETGLAVRAGNLTFVIEGAEGEKSHRVDLIFQCELLGKAEDTESRADFNQTGTDWLPVAELDQAPLYPSRLRVAIRKYVFGKEVPVYLGNENVGDPVYTEDEES